MNGRQKEVFERSLQDEQAVLDALTKDYTAALADVKRNIRELQANPLTQSKAYQLEYQKQLEKQISGIVDNLQGKNYSSVANYLQESYTNGFVGNMYDLQGQGVPLVIPIDERQVLKAVEKTGDDFKLANKLGVPTKELKKQVKEELQRGLATQLSYAEIARNISDYGLANMHRTMNIARTEGHRVQNEARMDSMFAAKEKGADIVKQWDSTLDGNTRSEHQELDGQIREIDEDFTVGSYSAPCPGAFGDPYMDCNCRCAMLQRARWALDKDELDTLKERAEFFGLDKTDSFEEFKEKYLNVIDNMSNMDYNKLYTKVKTENIPSMDSEKFERIKMNLKNKGIEIIQDNNGDEYLRAMGAEAITISDGSAIIFQSGRVPSASATFEEIIHTTQIKQKGTIDSFGGKESTVEYLNREIEANEKLLAHKEANGLTPQDIESVKENLKKYHLKMKEIEFDV